MRDHGRNELLAGVRGPHGIGRKDRAHSDGIRTHARYRKVRRRFQAHRDHRGNRHFASRVAVDNHFCLVDSYSVATGLFRCSWRVYRGAAPIGANCIEQENEDSRERHKNSPAR